jgi:hypothetical protein
MVLNLAMEIMLPHKRLTMELPKLLEMAMAAAVAAAALLE